MEDEDEDEKLFHQQSLCGNQARKDGDAAADEIWQADVMRVERQRKKRPENSRETARALCHANGCALLVGGREIGKQPEQWRACQARSKR